MKPLARLLLLLSLLFAIPALSGDARACPNCKEAYAESDGSSVAAGYSDSITLLMGVPVLLLAAITIRLWWTMRRTRGLAPDATGNGDTDTRIDPQP